jgi:hypothetical protein
LKRKTSCCHIEKEINGQNGICQSCVGPTCTHQFKHNLIIKAINEGLSKKDIPEVQHNWEKKENRIIFESIRDINERLCFQIKEKGLPFKILLQWMIYMNLTKWAHVQMITNCIRFHDEDKFISFELRRIVHIKYSFVLKYNLQERENLATTLIQKLNIQFPNEVSHLNSQ